MEQNGLFSFTQFGFKEGVGCTVSSKIPDFILVAPTEASFTILETINHMLDRGLKLFGCFLDVRKDFDAVWIDALLYELFSEFGIRGRIWLAIKDLHNTSVLETQARCQKH